MTPYSMIRRYPTFWQLKSKLIIFLTFKFMSLPVFPSLHSLTSAITILYFGQDSNIFHLFIPRQFMTTQLYRTASVYVDKLKLPNMNARHVPIYQQTQISRDTACLVQVWDHSKSTYALKGGEGVLQKRTKAYKGRGVFKERTYAHHFFKAALFFK